MKNYRDNILIVYFTRHRLVVASATAEHGILGLLVRYLTKCNKWNLCSFFCVASSSSSFQLGITHGWASFLSAILLGSKHPSYVLLIVKARVLFQMDTNACSVDWANKLACSFRCTSWLLPFFALLTYIQLVFDPCERQIGERMLNFLYLQELSTLLFHWVLPGKNSLSGLHKSFSY